MPRVYKPMLSITIDNTNHILDTIAIHSPGSLQALGVHYHRQYQSPPCEPTIAIHSHGSLQTLAVHYHRQYQSRPCEPTIAIH
jgi:hypothetical protein